MHNGSPNDELNETDAEQVEAPRIELELAWNRGSAS
jgi:hypothetical protein